MTDALAPVDTPVPQPPSRLEAAKGFVGDLARPFSIVSTSLSASIVPVIVAARVDPTDLDLLGAAAFVAAIYGGLGALYWGKSWEQAATTRAQANAEVAKAQAATQ